MTPAPQSSPTHPPAYRVLSASCSRQPGARETLLRLHLAEGQVLDFRLAPALAQALGLQPAILGVAKIYQP